MRQAAEEQSSQAHHWLAKGVLTAVFVAQHKLPYEERSINLSELALVHVQVISAATALMLLTVMRQPEPHRVQIPK